MSEINIRKIQEVMFDLYDVANGKISKFSKGYAKELAEKLEDVEQDLKARKNYLKNYKNGVTDGVLLGISKEHVNASGYKAGYDFGLVLYGDLNEDPDEQLGKQIYSGAFINKKVDTEK